MRLSWKSFAVCPNATSLAVMMWLPATAVAEPLGTWLTPPDRQGQTAHIEATPCGSAVCGRIVRVFSASGEEINAPTVGQRVFWDMLGDGTRFQGRAFVPAHNRSYDAEMRLSGNEMHVSGCLGPICQSQVWTRVR